MSKSGNAPDRLMALDSLRGIFAVMIVLLHSSADWHLLNSPLVRNSFIGVEFFFVLSGFVIAKSYGHRLQSLDQFTHFMIARFGRLWPLHAFMILLFLLYYGIMYAVRGAGPFGPNSPYSSEWIWEWNARELLFLNAFANEGYFFANFPAWSINAEFWAYVLFGLVLFAFRSSPTSRNVVLVAMAAAALAVVWGWMTPSFGAAWGSALFRAVFFFACGAFAFRVWKSGVLRKALGTTASEAALIACWLTILYMLHTIPMGGTIVTAVIAALLVISFAHNAGAISRFVLARPFVRLGDLSYSIYLTHIFVLSVITTVLREGAKVLGQSVECQRIVDGVEATVLCFGSKWLMDLLVATQLFLVIAVSQLTYAWIEVPGQRLTKSISRQRQGRRRTN